MDLKPFLLILVWFSSSGYGSDWGAGFGLTASESGDNRLRAGIMGSVSYDTYFLHIYDERERFHSVHKASQTFVLGKSVCPTLPLRLTCSVGVGAYLDTTSITYEEDAYQGQNKTDVSLMPGGSVGLSTSYQVGMIRCGGHWESLFIPAGIAGALFLANARKQLFTIFVGMDL